MPSDNSLLRLPGGAIIMEGLRDVATGRETIAAALVQLARGRFVRAGLWPETSCAIVPDGELRLYGLLRASGGDAYTKYNSLQRELVSFVQASDVQATRKRMTR